MLLTLTTTQNPATDLGADSTKCDSARWSQGDFRWDLVECGPKIPEVLRLVMKMVEDSTAFCVPDTKLMRKLKGRDVQLTHGLADSVEQLDKEFENWAEEVLHSALPTIGCWRMIVLRTSSPLRRRDFVTRVLSPERG